MFKTGKLLESMLASDEDENAFIPKPVHNDIHAKWLQRWTDLHSPLHGYCLDPEFNAHDHSVGAEALNDFSAMCDLVHGAGTAASAKAQKDWCKYNAKGESSSKRKHMDQCCRDARAAGPC